MILSKIGRIMRMHIEAISRLISPTADDLSCWPMNQILKFLAHSAFAFSFSLEGHFDNWSIWNCSRSFKFRLRGYLTVLEYNSTGQDIILSTKRLDTQIFSHFIYI